ncbi:hypothetical protein ENUP19_0245G0013 [Entamoeba nuttalli]|uniref:Uncharacterized protein n=1 Tax=Entamoeba nuttalli TaxID=412467 RepID=A0ABQ0DQQ9_9EUKA
MDVRLNKHFGLLRNINRAQNEVIEIHNKLIEWIEISYTKEDLIKIRHYFTKHEISDLNGIYRGFQNLIWKYSDEEIKELKELPKFIGEEIEETKKTAKSDIRKCSYRTKKNKQKFQVKLLQRKEKKINQKSLRRILRKRNNYKNY